MKLLLDLHIDKSSQKILHHQRILLTGSCFTAEIGNKLSRLKFSIFQNPNGILYDPVSICDSLNSCLENKIYTKADLFYLNDLWHSWQHHSVFSGANADEVLENINDSQKNAHNFLKKADWLIITPGSAFNYQLKETSQTVANCHKAPANIFNKRLIETNEIIYSLKNIIQKLSEFNPALKIIFTISPVRHIKDGIIENNRSKARLIDVVNVLTTDFDHVQYFPAYELVIDVLRDYRFYKDDLVHPTSAAVDYIFDQFSATYFADKETDLLKELDKIRIAKNHIPFNENTEAHIKFKELLLQKISALKDKYVYLDFDDEIDYFSA